MKSLLTFAMLAAVTGAAVAQTVPNPATSARSVSGQFTVIAARPIDVTRQPLRNVPATGWIRLEPTLLAVSAERIKQAVWRELEVTGAWRGQTVFALRPARSTNDAATVISERTPGGWNYRVEMPDQMTDERLVRAVVQVVLLELANRTAGGHAAEIPDWLREGLVYHLLSNYSAEIILNSPGRKTQGIAARPMMTETRRISPLERAHKTLQATTPLTFEELSWPAPGQLGGGEAARYQACAQLFTCELLQLPGGRAGMRNFVGALPGHLNWQLAFLQGFKAHFTRLLDVEKWWALQAAEFTGRDIIQTWPVAESWDKLAAALRVPVDVFISTNSLPARSELKLQAVLREWPFDRQEPALRRTLDVLGSLRLRLAPELAGIAGDYARVIDGYLAQCAVPKGAKLKPKQAASRLQLAQKSALQQLDALDARLEKMRLKPPPSGL
jgi:hypothetical protein